MKKDVSYEGSSRRLSELLQNEILKIEVGSSNLGVGTEQFHER